MASITAMKDPGVLYPFLAGLLLSLTLVSGQTTTSSPANSAPPNGTTYWTSNSMSTVTSMSTISCPSFTCNYSDCNAMYTSQNASMCAGAYCELIRLTDIGYQANCTDVCSSNACMIASQTGCCVECCNSTDCLNATFASMMPSTAIPTTTASMMPSTAIPTTTGPANWTSWNSSSMSMISCPSFICNYSDCNTMYTSQNASMCAGAYCQLIRLTDICYNASCTDFCGNACVNASQTGCCVDCCNSTDCLNATFASMISSTTIATTIVTTPSSTARTPSATTRPPATTATPATTKPKPPVTYADDVPMGNKCHTATCDDTEECYKSFGDAHVQPCAESDMHCELKRNKMGEKVMWTAGCTTSCSSETWCQSDSIPLSCHQECCNATKTSCLKLDGKPNVPNIATGGPHFHIELIGFLICLLCFGSLM